MSDTPIWLDAFPHDFDVAHERTLRGPSKVARESGTTVTEPAPW